MDPILDPACSSGDLCHQPCQHTRLGRFADLRQPPQKRRIRVHAPRGPRHVAGQFNAIRAPDGKAQPRGLFGRRVEVPMERPRCPSARSQDRSAYMSQKPSPSARYGRVGSEEAARRCARFIGLERTYRRLRERIVQRGPRLSSTIIVVRAVANPWPRIRRGWHTHERPSPKA